LDIAVLFYLPLLFVYDQPGHRRLRSFPTRRSSDLLHDPRRRIGEDERDVEAVADTVARLLVIEVAHLDGVRSDNRRFPRRSAERVDVVVEGERPEIT